MTAWQPIDPQAILDGLLTEFACQTATLHRYDLATRRLELVAQRGVPDVVLPAIRSIEMGKGMAGLAALRRECVSVCNLQTDTSGDVRPGAKMTGMEGAIAVPMIVAGELRGVLGVAKATAYEFTEAEKQQLLKAGALIAARGSFLT